ncbi:hypothetical protein NC796_07580 [Aliifodinibius sp. S!AR15-10]|uniref:head-tail connector protein n=1 Tax=Aliifodinibius sp. S!AR15-10 TaxID=2950437 RepID=UPI0028637541|nr:hypothetical protein [Aliifodinibius sp. S!AR15-10]MDR8390992.1 hypothetical protein [Aliifodinibius sp. S!AR15-10]
MSHVYYHTRKEDKQYPLEQTSTPVSASVSLSDAKDFFREDRTVEDSLITGLVDASEKVIEKQTGYNLIDTDYRMHLTSFENIKIPKKPYKSGSLTVKYDDTDGNEQTLSSTEYTVYKQENPVRIDFHGDNLPDLENADSNDYPVRVDFTIGYGTSESDVPERFKTSIKMIALILWKRDLPMTVDENLDPMQIKSIRTLISGLKIGRFH